LTGQRSLGKGEDRRWVWAKNEPKYYAWKILRAIDDRERWYELPEEVDGGP
jgi:hypothetical protein